MTLSRVEQWLWRAVLVTLPLGTIWILRFGEINGMPWALGNIGIGVGEAVAVCATAVSLLRSGIRGRFSVWLLAMAWLGLLFGRALGVPEALVSMLMILRYGLALLIVALMIPREEFVKWWAIGTVIPCVVGAMQVLFPGDIHGSTLLGIAPHVLSAGGTSVVEVAGRRIMRAYGTFPHPNIFGAYLAITIALVLRERERWANYALVILGFVLALTFSRGAIIAVVVYFVVVMLSKAKHPGVKDPSLALRMTAVTVGLILGIALFAPAYGVRVGAEQGRLETKSVDERVQSLKSGWRLFQSQPLVGVGVLQSVPTLAQNDTSEPVWSFESAHFLPLLMLAEWGILGAILFFAFIALEIKREMIPLAILLVALACFDHALFTSAQLVLLVPIAVQMVSRPYESS